MEARLLVLKTITSSIHSIPHERAADIASAFVWLVSGLVNGVVVNVSHNPFVCGSIEGSVNLTGRYQRWAFSVNLTARAQLPDAA